MRKMIEDVYTKLVNTRKNASIPVADLKFATDVTNHLKMKDATIQVATTRTVPRPTHSSERRLGGAKWTSRPTATARRPIEAAQRTIPSSTPAPPSLGTVKTTSTAPIT